MTENNFRVVYTPEPPENYRPNVSASEFPVGTVVLLSRDNQTRFIVKDDQRDGKYWERLSWEQRT